MKGQMLIQILFYGFYPNNLLRMLMTLQSQRKINYSSFASYENNA